jgi:molecular chaperone DnaJ
LRGYRRGDQLVQIQIETPSKLTREQKDLIRRFDELSDEKTYPLYRRFLSKIRETTKR